MKRKYIRGSQATYKSKDGTYICDTNKLAKDYSAVTKIPERISFLKATEISLMCKKYLFLLNLVAPKDRDSQ